MWKIGIKDPDCVESDGIGLGFAYFWQKMQDLIASDRYRTIYATFR